ncbi:MAG TPA: hypothetical protein VHW09_11435 [Bryobacteraceae bacterium]|jgi:hypothetical protein|nr:hypothetical protein [Bryobacteraceae bacterium]
MRVAYAAVLLTIVPLLAGEAGFDDHYYYRLTNSYLGEGYSLDSTAVGNLVPQMAQSSASAGQYWKFTAWGGCFRIGNVLLGSGYALDNSNSGTHPPVMAAAGNYSGQCWQIGPEHDGYVRLTNAYLGNSHSLDTYSNGKHLPFMAETGTATGQYWKLIRLSRQ